MGPTISVEYVRLIMNFAESSGLNPDHIYRTAGFDASVLDKSNARISFEQFSAIWDALEESTPDRDFGLHLGEKIFVFPGHILFLLMLNAPTINDAIDIFCRYLNLLTDVVSPHFSIKKNIAEITNHFHTPGLTPSRQSNEAVLSAYASILHRISENRIHFDGVYFVHPQPEEVSEHRRIFNAPLFFDQAENKLVFQTKYLTLPIILSNQRILVSLEKMARNLQERLYTYGPWSEKVSQTIILMLNRKKTKIESIARELAVSVRNLQNRLKKEGITYQKLLDLVRKEQAIYLLEQENIPISEIAILLGYSEQSAFNRAFKRWVGFTPGQCRSRFK